MWPLILEKAQPVVVKALIRIAATSAAVRGRAAVCQVDMAFSPVGGSGRRPHGRSLCLGWSSRCPSAQQTGWHQRGASRARLVGFAAYYTMSLFGLAASALRRPPYSPLPTSGCKSPRQRAIFCFGGESMHLDGMME